MTEKKINSNFEIIGFNKLLTEFDNIWIINLKQSI